MARPNWWTCNIPCRSPNRNPRFPREVLNRILNSLKKYACAEGNGEEGNGAEGYVAERNATSELKRMRKKRGMKECGPS